MKNLKYILAIFIITFSFSSCDDDGGTSVINLRVGAVTDIVKSPDYDGFLDIYKLEDGNDVTIGFSLDIPQGDVSSADLVAFYNDGTNTFGPSTIQSGITKFPTDFTMNQNDIVNAFDELSSPEDIKLGDVLTLTGKLYLNDGSTIDILNEDGSNNFGSDVSSSKVYSVTTTYPVACPSDLAGVYNVISNGESTDGQPPAVDLPYTVTITANGGGSYTISDGVAGVYIFWYSIYGYTFETEGNFTEVCTELSGKWTESFGCEIVLTGKVNDDGTLSIHWDNCFGDFADAVYTKQ